jgi:RNA polymerase sigma-70 factor (ECF subfamily)
MADAPANLDAPSGRPIGEWLQAARDGSREAIGQLFEACRTYLLLVANRELPSDVRAKVGASDLVQDTFLDCHRSFGLFKGDTEAELLAWLRRILLCNISDFNRRYVQTTKRQIAREIPLEFDGVSRAARKEVATARSATASWQAVVREEAEAVEQAIRRLPDDYRRVIILVHREHRSFAQAAEVLNRSVPTVHRLWLRAVEMMSLELETDHECRRADKR